MINSCLQHRRCSKQRQLVEKRQVRRERGCCLDWGHQHPVTKHRDISCSYKSAPSPALATKPHDNDIYHRDPTTSPHKERKSGKSHGADKERKKYIKPSLQGEAIYQMFTQRTFSTLCQMTSIGNGQRWSYVITWWDTTSQWPGLCVTSDLGVFLHTPAIQEFLGSLFTSWQYRYLWNA